MIQPVQIFSPDPGKVTDFTGIPVAQIFNATVVARSQVMEREQAGESSAEETPKSPEQSDVSAKALFSQERGAELFGMPVAMPTVAADPGNDYNAPMKTGSDPADFIFDSEARRDSQGRLRVYVPPSGDGGGAFEIAGITAKYQPKEAARLKSLIEAGQSDQAEAEAKAFYRRRAAPFTRFTNNPGLQLQLADTVHHRGEGGLRRVLQRATGSSSEDYGELIRALSEDSTALDKFHQARQAYEWEEVDRGRASRKKFRQGLQNRFNNANAAARKLLTR